MSESRHLAVIAWVSLRSQPDWPQSTQSHDGRHSTVPRKALAHAAVTVLRPDAPNAEPLGTRLRWAVFLPLDDDPEPRSSEIVESAKVPLLRGKSYFMAIFGRPRTADPFPASPMILATVRAIPTTCVIAGTAQICDDFASTVTAKCPRKSGCRGGRTSGVEAAGYCRQLGDS